MTTCTRGSKPYIAPEKERCDNWYKEVPGRYRCQRGKHTDGKHRWRSIHHASGQLSLRWNDWEGEVR